MTADNPKPNQPDMQKRRQVYDTEIFKIIEGALQHQGVRKPLTDEFYESVIEAYDYVAEAVRLGKVEQLQWVADIIYDTQHMQFKTSAGALKDEIDQEIVKLKGQSAE